MENPQRRNKKIDLIMCSDPGIVQDAEVVNMVRISDPRLIRAKITLNLKRTRTKLITRKQANFDVVRAKAEFRIALKNKHEALGEREYEDIKKVYEDVTKLITEAAIEVGGKALRQDVNKLFESTKN